MDQTNSRFTFKNANLAYISFFSTSEKQKENKKNSSDFDKKPGNILLFHATGYSALSYRPLIRLLTESGRNVHALNFLGHGGSESGEFHSWYDFRDQVTAFASHIGEKNLDAVGHSIGGATMLLSQAKEGLFRRCAALDPVVLSPFVSRLAPFLPHPLALKADKRRANFKNLEIVRRSYRMVKEFKYWTDDSFDGYLESAFKKNESGYELVLPPHTEAAVFRSFNGGHWGWYKKLKSPVLVIAHRGATETPAKSARRLASGNSHSRFIPYEEDSHFFPMEKPEWTATQILDFFDADFGEQ